MKQKKIKIPRVEEADVQEMNKKYLRKRKNRAERRNAKKDPECPASYGKYSGWAS